MKFSNQADILPGFQEAYEEIKGMNKKPLENIQQRKVITKRIVEGNSEYADMFLKRDKYTKIRESWRLLLDNIKLANVINIYIYIIKEIIDNEDFRKYKVNEILEDMISAMKTSEKNLLE